jgi:hypothetical protein
MLARARRKHPEVWTCHEPLTALDEHDACDTVICVDAMENVPPEDWPAICRNFARALQPGGWLNPPSRSQMTPNSHGGSAKREGGAGRSSTASWP